MPSPHRHGDPPPPARPMPPMPCHAGANAVVDISATTPPKTPRCSMPIVVRLDQVAEPAVEARLGLRVVLPPPLPEELLDLRHVRAAGDVLDRLVVDGHHGRADERLAVGVGQLDLDLGLLARLVRRLRGLDLDVRAPASPAERRSRSPRCRPCRRATVTASTKKLGMSFFTTPISSTVLLPPSRTTFGGR